MNYKIKQVAKITGLSIRALHYYDQIDLLKPNHIKANGYRSYGEKELAKLQQILFFRELAFPLEKIKFILSSKKFNANDALLDQKKLLEIKKQKIEKLLETIDLTIKFQKGGVKNMTNDNKFSAFNDPTYKKYKDEVQKKWGNTDAYKQSIKRIGKMTKAELDSIKDEAKNITNSIADLMKKGFAPDSSDVQDQIELFYKHLHNFYDPNYEMFKGLGKMYIEDRRFTKTYEDIAKGLAKFKSDAMIFYSDNHLKKQV